MELWSNEWFERARKRADELGLIWCMAGGSHITTPSTTQAINSTLVIASPKIDFKYPIYDDIEIAIKSAQAGLDILSKVTNENGPFSFVGQGTSGASASAIGCMLRPKSQVIQFRKEGDVAHTGDHGAWHLERGLATVFMDDTIETGDTIRRVNGKLKQSKQSGIGEHDSIDYVIFGGTFDFLYADEWIREVRPKVVICTSITP